MMDVMAIGTKIRRYMDTHGIEKVEAFIDASSVENLLDVNLLFGVTNNDGAKSGVMKLMMNLMGILMH